MKKYLVLIGTLILMAVLLSGCKEKVDPAVWNCPIAGLEWGMSVEDAQAEYDLVPYQNGDTYEGYLLEDMTFFDIDCDIALFFDKNIGLDNLKFSFKEETPGELKKKLSVRYGTSETDKEKDGKGGYGGYWKSPDASTLYTDDEIFYAYRMYYKISTSDGAAMELKALANGSQPLYYVRLIENDDGEGTCAIAATMSEVLKLFMKK